MVLGSARGDAFHKVIATACVFALAGCGAEARAKPTAVAPPAPASPAIAQSSAPEVTFASLLADLYDLERLTHAPAPTYTSHLASSYDRRSLHAAPGSDDWFANRDFATLAPDEPLVLLEQRGAGVITHLWSANPSGTLRVFIDERAEPLIEAPMRELLSGAVPPFTAPLSFIAAGGYNLYFPIAFQTHVRIEVASTAAKPRPLFYQVDYRRYPATVRVEPLSLPLTAANGAALETARAELTNQLSPQSPGALHLLDGSTLSAPDVQSSPITLDPRQTWTATARAASGGSVLRELRMSSLADRRALRALALAIDVDGEATVRVPLADFFEPVGALPVARDEATQTLIARWPMPFRDTLRLGLENHGPAQVTLTLTSVATPRPFSDDTRLLYAAWHAPDWQKSEPTHDFTLLQARGDGAYVGNVLHVINTDASWWGEGDEKVFVDDETFPSRFGTGTEDYYGYAYCSNGTFSTPWLGQPRAGKHKSFGEVALYRFHTLDAIAFTKRLRFDLEVNHWGHTARDVEYDAVVFLYARPGAQLTLPKHDDSAYELSDEPPPPADVPEGHYQCGGDVPK